MRAARKLYERAESRAVEAEGALAELKTVKIRIVSVQAELRSLLHFNLGVTETDIFIYGITIAFRNESHEILRAFFPKVELSRKRLDGQWEVLELRRLEPWTLISHSKGLPNQHTYWHPERRNELGARDETIGEMGMMHTAPGGASAFLNREFKVRLTIDIIGQPETVLEVPLPRVTNPSA